VTCRVDPKRNLLFVKGSLPGPQGCFVYVKDAHRKRSEELQALPFPAYLGDPGDAQQARPKKNAYDMYQD
jgi:large subunit ribosomal protein L3